MPCLFSLSASPLSSRKELISLSRALLFVTATQGTTPDYQVLGAIGLKYVTGLYILHFL